VTPTPGGWHLQLPPGPKAQYRLAQLDDYASYPRRDFPHRFIDLRLTARASSSSIPGTWGFGVWNDSFGVNLGGTGSAMRLPALPNAAWFFHASPPNYLSLRDDVEAQGFLAQTFRSPRFHRRLILAALTMPFSQKQARTLLSSVVEDAGFNLGMDIAHWHKYRLRWSEEQVLFEVDGASVFQTAITPRPPLGLVIWIDNQYARFTPAGQLGFGTLENPDPAWLEIKEIEHEAA